ncbi:hypothetical protein M9Y10_026071 [Tritrichomonas musculus]|uniref:DUF3447 domain-containing protein n=1 Tax=Tritrichomonas musculus TaxID=1915356 RepID=A0ABR2H8D4_9EUKA
MEPELQNYLHKIKKIQNSVLQYIDDEQNLEENFQNLLQMLNDQKILEDRPTFKLILHLISTISNNHHRSPTFSSKFERILNQIKNDITKNFSNYEIFQIFKKNPKILYFLLQNKFVTFNDHQIISYVSDFDNRYFYLNYFSNELGQINSSFRLDDSYNGPLDEEKRKIGENDAEICSIIRNDAIDDFINFVSKNSIDLTMKIEPSIYETNPFLFAEEQTLIEYSAFFGSIKIFTHLYNNGVSLSPSLWNFAAHGNNLEIICFLQKKKIKPEYEFYDFVLEEAIKCHHNEIANYVKNTLMKEDDIYGLSLYSVTENDYYNDILNYSYHYYNFAFFSSDFANKFTFYYACQYDYYEIVDLLLKTKKIDLNAKIILFF